MLPQLEDGVTMHVDRVFMEMTPSLDVSIMGAVMGDAGGGLVHECALLRQ